MPQLPSKDAHVLSLLENVTLSYTNLKDLKDQIKLKSLHQVSDTSRVDLFIC